MATHEISNIYFSLYFFISVNLANVNHAQIPYSTKPVLSYEVKVSCSRKQWEP